VPDCICDDESTRCYVDKPPERSDEGGKVSFPWVV